MNRLLMFAVFAGVAATSAACVPTMPSQFAESTETLDKGHVGITVAGGGGGIAACCSNTNNGPPVGFGGGEARLRVGVGGGQEIGVSAFGGAGGGTGSTAGALGGKLAYKIAPAPWIAIVANAGAYDYMGSSNGGLSHTAVFGGDLAAILAAKLDDHGTNVYSGLRGSFVIPVLSGAHGATETFTVPVGFMLKTSELVRVFFEGGFVLSFAQFIDEGPPPSFSGDTTTLGGYGTVGVQFILP